MQSEFTISVLCAAFWPPAKVEGYLDRASKKKEKGSTFNEHQLEYYEKKQNIMPWSRQNNDNVEQTKKNISP
jgi:hypothetical protein